MSEGSDQAPASWKLPEGVDVPLWHYSRSTRLAESEDDYFRQHPLFQADAQILRERFVEPGPLIDLGCGAGRLSVEFAERGFRVTSVDLSQPMLREATRKALSRRRTIFPVRANLCRLGCFPSETFQYALAMFSTFGMIRSPAMRRRALSETYRILQADGRLALHAHNVWLNLHDRQGRRWLFEQLWRAIRGLPGFGDRTMMYRGVPSMSVHLYRWSELRRDLLATGFSVEHVIPLDAISAQVIPARKLLSSVRAGGWIVIARKSTSTPEGRK